MSSIPGPIIIFKIDAPQTASATQGVFQEAKAQARAASQSIADDWKRMAAQIRASIAQGTSTDSQVLTSRRQLVSLLDQELSARRNLSSASSKELATYRAMTLELERQKSFLKGTGGLTTGTANALNQVSTQTFLGVSRTLDALVNRYFGGAAGAAFRTARDLAYYGSMGGSGVAAAAERGAAGVAGAAGRGGEAAASAAGRGGEAAASAAGTGASATAATGMLGGLKNALSGIVDTIGTGTLVVTGFVGALAAVAGAAAKITIGLADDNQQIENMSAITGVSTQNVQVLSEAARQLGIDTGGVTMSIARFQGELGEYIRKGSNADQETIRFVASMKSLGIAVEQNGKLRDPIAILEDLSDVLRAIPDPSERAARALDALGTRGRELLPMLVSNRMSFRDLVTEIQKDGPIIGDGMSSSLDRVKTSWDRLTESIHKNSLEFKEWVASGVISVMGYNSLGGGQLTPQQLQYQQARKLGMGGVSAGTSVFLGTPVDNETLLKQAEIIKSGGQEQYKLMEAEKNYAQAVKDNNGVLAKQYADQVKSLQAIISLEQSRAAIYKRLMDEVNAGHVGGHPSLPAKTPDEIINQILYPSSGAPNIGSASSLPSVSLGGILGTGTSLPQDVLDQIKKINQERYDETASASQKIKDTYSQELAYFEEIQSLYPQYAQQISDTIVGLKQDEARKLAAIQKQEFEKYKSQADSLFDDLLSGHTKQFGKALQKDVEDILLAPIKNAFSNVLGGMLQRLAGTVNSAYGGGAGSSSGTGASTNTSRSGLGGIFGSLGGIFGPVTPPFIGNFIGGHGSVGGSGSGQFITQTMYVSAGTVSIGGSGSATSSNNIAGMLFGSGGSSLSSQLFGTGSSTSSSGSGSSGGIFGSLLSSIFGGGSSSSGGSSSGGGLLGKLSSIWGGGSSSGGSSGGRNNPSTEAKIATSLGVIGGTLLMAVGKRQGGALGGLEGAAGGAISGFAVGGPVGAIVGALVGGITGALGGPNFQQRVATAMWKQQYNAPPQETFSFASNGSIANTLGTGFSQSGRQFGMFGLPSNTPFYASAITGPLNWRQQQLLGEQTANLGGNQPFGGFNPNPYSGYAGQGTTMPGASPTPILHVHLNLPGYVDGPSAEAALGPVAQTLARMVGSQVTTSASGIGRQVRQAANLP